jgi:A/G-specific adenine glycosylase
LLASARAVVQRHGGALPADSAALRELPGIGRYSAGAIASIAFGRREPIVDGNVARVLCRFFALRGDATRGPLQRRLWELAAALVPADRPGDFNQALMELGATLCSVRAPRCDSCPLADQCRSRSLGMAEQLPEPVRRAAATAVHMVAAVVRRRGRVLVARTADDAPRWAGMWQFPTATLAPGEAPDAGTRRALRESVGSKDVDVHGLVVVVRHAVTRFAITLDAYACTLHGRLHPPHRGAAAWKQPHELGELALPAAHRKIARQLGA